MRLTLDVEVRVDRTLWEQSTSGDFFLDERLFLAEERILPLYTEASTLFRDLRLLTDLEDDDFAFRAHSVLIKASRLGPARSAAVLRLGAEDRSERSLFLLRYGVVERADFLEGDLGDKRLSASNIETNMKTEQSKNTAA